MLKEHDRAILTEDLPAEGLRNDDVGVIVHVYRSGKTFEIEFLALAGNTITVATVLSSQVRPVTPQDVSHARSIEALA